MSDLPTERPDGQGEPPSLSDRLLDLLVFLPTGVAVTVAEELPGLVDRGRERLGVHVNSARAVGEFAVTAGGQELKRRSAARLRGPEATASRPGGTPGATARRTVTRLRTIPYPEDRPAPDASPSAPATPAATPAGSPSPSTPSGAAGPAPTRPAADAHIPDVASLAIPGFDTLSASQVVQRLDGLSRGELVAVRAYETSTRGRRTILSRVDQLLDERS